MPDRDSDEPTDLPFYSFQPGRGEDGHDEHLYRPPSCGGDHHCPSLHGPDGGDYAPTIYRAKYSLPAALESLYFLSKGAHAHGTFRYEMAHADSNASNITINVEMRYWRKDARESINMCVLRRSKTHMGFGIFVCQLLTLVITTT